MKAITWILGVIVLPLVVLLSGCRTPPCNKVVLADPLLVSRKPVDADPVTSPPVLVAASEPMMPPHPFGSEYAAKPPRYPSGLLTSTPSEESPPTKQQ